MAKASEEIRRIVEGAECSTLEEVAEAAAKRLGISKAEAAYEVVAMWKRGELELESPGEGAAAYLLGGGGLWYWGLLAVTALAALSTLASGGPLIYARYALGALLTFFLPGYALVEALYPRGDELGPLERLALSIGLSLALTALIGLALNYSPWGVRQTPVVASVSGATAALLTIAAARKAVSAGAARRCGGGASRRPRRV
ncbi:MAG: DUF1616 domain-containing protein [Thermoproteus sp. AZ2]|jgi:hypothetical protein|uniref:DUF1616 domain-containing protein n=1 Tax=Thermoproteus sp. AZ2 TaxID=1609232 RepID=A0ACC6V2G4_9CREN|nr:MAG: hypothetical protein TU36_00150 [Vulcanisaeta sp. AZ3]